MKQLLTKAIYASIRAGQEILKIYTKDDFQITEKADQSPLTLADKNAHLTIMHYLEPLKIPILSEEGKHENYNIRKNWTRFWLIDPLDGTKEFIKRNGEFTVNIALIENRKPIAGVIYVPVTKELYFGTLDTGAFKIENFDESKFTENESFEDFVKQATKLPTEFKARKYTVVGSRSHLSQQTQTYFEQLRSEKGEIEIITKGSSIKICMIAEGKADIYPRFGPTMEWDTAAGHAIVRSAGGTLTYTDSSDDIIYNKENLLNPFFIVKSHK